MNITRRAAFTALVGSAGLFAAPPCLVGKGHYSEAKRARLKVARKRRRVIFVDDNYGLSHQGSDTPGGFLKPRLKPLVGTHVDTITYAVYAHSPAYISKTHPRHYAAAGGTSVTDQAWARHHKALVKAGHDPLQLVVDFAHGNGMEAFAHMSMNDCHDSFMPNLMNPFKAKHPELLVNPQGVLPNLQLYVTAYDFSHKEVRDRQFSIVEEVCDRYDVDGFEMDFIRHPMFFSRCIRGEPATKEEIDIMTSFMGRIRKRADEIGVRRGKPVLLSARVPDSFDLAIHLGMDLKSWISRDLIDIVIAGGGYASNTLAVADFVELAHQHDVLVYPCINQKPWSCDKAWRREGNRALAATWHQAGVDGIHFWNLATPFDPYSIQSQQELVRIRKKVYACLTEVGEAETLRGKDKLYCLDSTVFHHYQHISSEPPLPVHLMPGAARKIPLVLGDDVQAAAKADELAELRLELILHGPLLPGMLTLRVNDQLVTGGELLPTGYAHSHEHRHATDGQSEPHSHVHFQANQLSYLLSAPPLRLGRNEIEVSLQTSRQVVSGPLKLVNAQLWVKYKGGSAS